MGYTVETEQVTQKLKACYEEARQNSENAEDSIEVQEEAYPLNVKERKEE